MTENSSARGQTTTASPPPAFSSFTGFNSAAPSSQSSTPKQAHSAFAPPAQVSAKDPFAGLGSHGFSSKPATPKPATPSNAPQPAAANDEDEWSFSSALPPEAPAQQPREHREVVSNTTLKIELMASRSTPAASSINLLFAFTNITAQPVSELHFQLAVTKVRTWLFHDPYQTFLSAELC